MKQKINTVICVALHPAIDRVIEVEAIAAGEHVKGKTTTRHPAGKAVNVARILGELGHRAMLTGFVGEAEARWFEDFVAADGVNSQLFAVPGSTRENITLIDREGEREMHVRDVGFTVRDEDLAKLGSKIALLAKPEVAMVFAGSLPLGVSEDQFLRLVRIAIEREACVVVDASGPAANAAVREPLMLVKPNETELEAMVARPVTGEADRLAACRELTRTVDYVLLSLGAEGAMLAGRRTALAGRVALETARIRNTVGCGDALLAGLLAGMLEGAGNREALVRALAVATAAAVETATGEINTVRVDEFAAKVEVHSLDA